LATRQLLQPSLPLAGLASTRASITPNQLHWTLGAGVLRTPGELSIVLSQSANNIVRNTCIERVVGTAQQIDVPVHIGCF